LKVVEKNSRAQTIQRKEEVAGREVEGEDILTAD
jgi:hypothetical protein